MPIYAYRCNKCGAEEEHIQKMSDPPIKKCSSCGGKLEKLMTRASFKFKGGGWASEGYATPVPGRKQDGRPPGKYPSQDSYSTSKEGGEGKADSGGDAKSGDAKSGESKTKSEPSTKSKGKAASE